MADANQSPRIGLRNDIHAERPTLRRDEVPPLRSQRAAASRNLARVVAELWRWPVNGDAAGNVAPGVRSWRDPFRSRQQLRSAIRVCRSELRPNVRAGFSDVSRR